ncbi:unnamed protein product [Schistosoma mattheei]|uniref:Uncharacterized protein n=1 Tax=Schistosoma mattheei TaxID=31246 RepID=A0A183P6S0_9TREM|nr:unnamed protein product [Schistosoma mattheei]
MSTSPVKAPDIRFSSSQFRKQHPYHEKAVSRTSLAEAIYVWSCESISRGSGLSLLSAVPGHSGANKLSIRQIVINKNNIFLIFQ